MNLNGGGKNVISFENLILRSWWQSRKSRPGAFELHLFRYWTTILIGAESNHVNLSVLTPQCRFDINDRKGLEIVLLTALLTFQDANEAYHTPTTPSPLAPADSGPSRPGFFSMSRRVSDSVIANNSVGNTPLPTPPALPPRPMPKIGVEKIAETQAIRVARGEGEVNEIEVGEDASVEDYAHHMEGMLRVSSISNDFYFSLS
jgi:hypothetical protein